jgi:hypothetical protein
MKPLKTFGLAIKTKILIPLLALACLVAVPATAQVNYVIFGGAAAHVAYSPNASGDIVIASTYNGYPVTWISGKAFSNCTHVTSVTIPNSVTTIGIDAFSHCTGLTNVTIPNGVTTIGNAAFSNCTNLTSVMLGSSVTTIYAAFYNCTSLTNFSVNPTNSAYSSRDGVLFNKEQTTLITFPPGRGGSYVIPDSVTSIGDETFSGFSGCTRLTSVTMGDSVTNIADVTFSDCTSLKNVTIGNSVTSIGGYAFYNCTSLTNVTIPDSVITIGIAAFGNCTNLINVTVGSSVASIENQAFSGCSTLTNLSVDAGNSVYSSLNGVLFNKAQTTLLTFPPGRGGNYGIPNSVTTIAGSAFSHCTRLTSVTIPNSVTTIGNDAFLYCSGLTNVMLGSSITDIAYGTFWECANLTTVTIPDSVTTIEYLAFYNCANLINVALGSGVTNIRDGAFSGCALLTNFSVDAANPVYSSLDGVLLNKAQTILIMFPFGRGGDYVIPSSVTTIEYLAFYERTRLTSVTIPDSVTNIGDHAFSDCTSLTSMTIGNSVTSIGSYAFYECTSLTNVTIPNSVTSIGFYAFSYCANLINVALGSGVTNIRDGTFFGCTSLTNFSVDAANSVYSSLNRVLFNKTQTTLIIFPPGRGGDYVIPSTTTTIGNLAFHHCRSLMNVTIPNSVTTIGRDAFYYCTRLTSVTIPSSVTSIGNSAFYSCTNLTNFTFSGNAPFLASEFDIFLNVGPSAMIYYYYGTTGWRPLYGGLPTLMLGAPAPQVGSGTSGMKPGGFGFTIAGVVNQTIVVEASTNLVTWQPIRTNTLSAVSTSFFVDPQWLNHPRRFYRLRSN